MRYQVQHETEYRYSQPVTLGHSSLHLRPRPVDRQRCLAMAIDISPRPAVMTERTDYFGNPVDYFIVQQHHQAMTISTRCTIEVDRVEPLIDGVSKPWETVRDSLRSDTSPAGLDAYQHTFDSALAAGTPEFAGYAAESFPPGRPILDGARDLTQRISDDFTFDPTTTNVATPVKQVFEQRSGVCQDFAHLMIALLRALGLPARYVSGYLRTYPPPGQPRLQGVDASHAWVGVYCPDFGWADFDPTNNKLVASDHITVAWGRDYADVAPVKGLVLGGDEHYLSVRVDVAPESAK
ncbi:MAG: transglutaminase family protein [Planctomycetota bacterium]